MHARRWTDLSPIACWLATCDGMMDDGRTLFWGAIDAMESMRWNRCHAMGWGDDMMTCAMVGGHMPDLSPIASWLQRCDGMLDDVQEGCDRCHGLMCARVHFHASWLRDAIHFL